MNIQQARQKLNEQFNNYLIEVQHRELKEYRERKKYRISVPLNNQKSTQRDASKPPILEQFKYQDEPKKGQIKQQIDECTNMFHLQYGYCLTQMQFECLIERLEILRKSLFKKTFGQLNLEQLEQFLPKQILNNIAKWLPLTKEELLIHSEKCEFNVDCFGEIIIKEIKYFMKQQQIDKTKIYYDKDIIDQMEFLDEMNIFSEDGRKSDEISDIDIQYVKVQKII